MGFTFGIALSLDTYTRKYNRLPDCCRIFWSSQRPHEGFMTFWAALALTPRTATLPLGTTNCASAMQR